MKPAREIPRDLQAETGYPGLFCVLFSIRFPDWTAHMAGERCPIEHPHLISECKEFDEPNP